MRIKKFIFILLVILLACMSGAVIRLQATYNDLSLYATSLQTQVGTLQQEVTTLTTANEQLQEKLKGTLPYSKANGEPIQLLNNFGGVHNPTWAELKAFLSTDSTESYTYQMGSFVCGDFAEMLHNNAERVGIRAAVVIVHFTEGELHALNAFYTTDRGLVYIDDTGTDILTYNMRTGQTSSEGEDKVAYVVEGQELGLVDLDVVTSLDYSFYTSYEANLSNYNTRVELYNSAVDSYTLALGGRIYLEEPEYSYFENWYNRLEQERMQLESEGATLGNYWWKPLGIVTKVETFW